MLIRRSLEVLGSFVSPTTTALRTAMAGIRPLRMNDGHAASTAVWAKKVVNNRVWWLHNSNISGAGNHVVFELPCMPPGMLLAMAQVRVIGVANAALPNPMPTLRVGRLAPEPYWDDPWEILASQADTSTSTDETNAFNATHMISLSLGSSVPITEGNRYAILVDGFVSEAGSMRLESGQYQLTWP